MWLDKVWLDGKKLLRFETHACPCEQMGHTDVIHADALPGIHQKEALAFADVMTTKKDEKRKPEEPGDYGEQVSASIPIFCYFGVIESVCKCARERTR